ncbi:MAG TPA: HIT domain-containing protein [Burkholderiaceae bacterium]|nr:HIT domain-containing protein [Burkholderiaceae bacterium]
MACPFCTLSESRVRFESALAVGVDDAYPVSPGHTLIVPRRHVGSYFELSHLERQAMNELLDQAQKDLANRLQPDAYTIGINDGPAAGQSIPHVHIHLIPRFRGDRDNPRGGVRWVLPQKADYWSGR